MIDPLINPENLNENEQNLKEFIKSVFQEESYESIISQNRSHPKITYFLASEINLIDKLKNDTNS